MTAWATVCPYRTKQVLRRLLGRLLSRSLRRLGQLQCYAVAAGDHPWNGHTCLLIAAVTWLFPSGGPNSFGSFSSATNLHVGREYSRQCYGPLHIVRKDWCRDLPGSKNELLGLRLQPSPVPTRWACSPKQDRIDTMTATGILLSPSPPWSISTCLSNEFRGLTLYGIRDQAHSSPTPVIKVQRHVP